MVLAIGTASICVAAGNEAGAHAARVEQFSGTSITHANAVVMAIDTRRNSITLLEDNGDPVDLVVDRTLGDVSKLRLGDTVAITFSRALLLRADKSNSSGIRERIDKRFVSGAPLGSALAMHRVEAVATVVRIDRDKRLLTLRGATRTVVLQASSNRVLDGLVEGESVRVDYVEATAIKIMRHGAPVR